MLISQTTPVSNSAMPPIRASIARPGFKFLLSHLACFIALGAGSGLVRWAPGTVGTLWAWASFSVLSMFLDTPQMGVLIAVSALVGWWACTRAAQLMQVSDPGSIVWDEIVAFWLVLWLLTPAGFGAQLAAFLLFRFFDTVKPGPVAWADELFHGFGWKGGLGIMLDDLVAAFCTLLVMAWWKF